MQEVEFCFVDMDGVLTDFVRAMCEAHRRPDPFGNLTTIGHYDMYELFEIDPDVFWEVAEHDFWANMHWADRGRDVYRLVKECFPIEQITILSAPSKNLGSSSGKVAWIKRETPDLERRFIFAPNKYYIAGPGKLLIDDNDTNCEMWEKAGGTSFLYPRPWNTRHRQTPEAFDLLHEYLESLHIVVPDEQYVKK